ncbi:hypothetical protein [Chryseobacterium sp. G0201]|uniref:hypothetical protein n=1 Tax=Chryseobacterium sp. G0201 TaxID=2487065 RepID=UPI000F503483|nr:hypothetical protein [Chryseobacterium sp. G0201]AZA54553.1 hypothetical protein EG348_16915 [Chryseobacterium sp. G0201]
MKKNKLLLALTIVFAIASAFKSSKRSADRPIWGWSGSYWVLADENDVCTDDPSEACMGVMINDDPDAGVEQTTSWGTFIQVP